MVVGVKRDVGGGRPHISVMCAFGAEPIAGCCGVWVGSVRIGAGALVLQGAAARQRPSMGNGAAAGRRRRVLLPDVHESAVRSLQFGRRWYFKAPLRSCCQYRRRCRAAAGHQLADV